MARIDEIKQLVIAGRSKALVALVTEELANGVKAREILEEGLMNGMNEVGTKFKNDEMFVPEVLVSAKAMNMAIDVLKPHLNNDNIQSKGVGIICTVLGDLHDVGKNLVKIMLEGVGIQMIDLGTNVSKEKVVEAIKEHNPNIVCLSALLTTTMPYFKDIIEEINKCGLRDKVKIMVGGAPVTQQYADQVGADAYTPDAGSASQLALSFLK